MSSSYFFVTCNEYGGNRTTLCRVSLVTCHSSYVLLKFLEGPPQIFSWGVCLLDLQPHPCFSLPHLHTYIPYVYKFSREVYFANAQHLTIFAILISRIAVCSCKRVLYVYKFSRFHFHKHPLIRKIGENKVPQNLYAYSTYCTSGIEPF